MYPMFSQMSFLNDDDTKLSEPKKGIMSATGIGWVRLRCIERGCNVNCNHDKVRVLGEFIDIFTG